MSSVYRIGTADTFAGQYRDAKTFIESLLGRLKVEARRQGWHGTALYDAEITRERGKPDMYFVALSPGLGEVSVAEIRAFLVDKKRKQKVAA